MRLQFQKMATQITVWPFFLYPVDNFFNFVKKDRTEVKTSLNKIINGKLLFLDKFYKFRKNGKPLVNQSNFNLSTIHYKYYESIGYKGIYQKHIITLGNLTIISFYHIITLNIKLLHHGISGFLLFGNISL